MLEFPNTQNIHAIERLAYEGFTKTEVQRFICHQP